MPPFYWNIVPRSLTFDPNVSSGEFFEQWTHPKDVFSVLLILGGDVVGRALAQLAGGWLTPPTFSFGWVAYSVTALVSAVGENKLMPTPDCTCIAINGKSGYGRSNSSWILGRLVRDYDTWMDPKIKEKENEVINASWNELREAASQKNKPVPERPKQAGLCVSIYKPTPGVKVGEPVYDRIHLSTFLVASLQLIIAAIPCGLFGDWGILMITACGILLSFLMASLPQWKNEKWACRRLDHDSDKNVVLTRGNGSQHAIVILGSKGFLNLEDLAGGQTNVDVSTSNTTRAAIAGLTFLWILLLITAAGLEKNTWFLLAVGGIGILENILIAGVRRNPAALGIAIDFVEVFGDTKVMKALYAVENDYPYLGRSMRDTFFPGNLRPHEVDKWNTYERTARDRAAIKAAAQKGTILGVHRYFTTQNAATQNAIT